ncbi:ABC transporter permease [Rathayibacter toxicus]|uniref:ABC transporter permease n=2 Tax=Rathayibacter toxicus TaxID=145458 RepID=A0A0U1PVQ8_9MICO|nr:ABC transporter permease subunit [Rathayibacter toxicus]ALS57844.1 ABC transporter permease [Rathayibacter toxicus]KKM46959.1 ABC transporter permease [Rathayibacter toxicus]
MAAMSGRVVSRVILVLTGIIFAVPLIAMVEFTLRGAHGADLSHWVAVFDPARERGYRALFQGIGNSVILAMVTALIVLVLLVPTMLLVEIRVPRLRRPLELVCLLPLTVPAIVFVVGLAPVYAVVTRCVGSAPWTLAFAYGVLVLPYAYRAVSADLAGMDVVTLSEAARSLGAGWGVVLVRVILPNLRRGLVAAALITVAVVLGEYTIASLLSRTTLQTGLVQVSKSDAYIAVIFSLLSLVFAFVLLVVIGRLARLGLPLGEHTRSKGSS